MAETEGHSALKDPARPRAVGCPVWLSKELKPGLLHAVGRQMRLDVRATLPLPPAPEERGVADPLHGRGATSGKDPVQPCSNRRGLTIGEVHRPSLHVRIGVLVVFPGPIAAARSGPDDDNALGSATPWRETL